MTCSRIPNKIPLVKDNLSRNPRQNTPSKRWLGFSGESKKQKDKIFVFNIFKKYDHKIFCSTLTPIPINTKEWPRKNLKDPYNLPTVHHKKTGLGHAQSVHTLCFGEENFFGEEIRDWNQKLALGVKKSIVCFLPVPYMSGLSGIVKLAWLTF